MHIHKTGALIRACILMACACKDGISAAEQDALDHFAMTIGLAFQVQDDILDIDGDTKTLGKTQGADVAANKATYPAILGMAGAKEKADKLYHDAIGFLNDFDEKADNLRNIADFIVKRRL